MYLLIKLISALVNAYVWVIIIYVLMSWLPHDRGILGDIYRVLGAVCEPYLGLFRRLIPPIGGMVDITPIIALFVLEFGAQIIIRLLYAVAGVF